MRVIHFDTEKGFRGGEAQVLALMRGLGARRVEQLLIARGESELADRAEKEGLAVRRLRSHAVWNPRTKSEIKAIVREFRPNLLHAHTGNGHTLAVKASAGRVPVLVTRRVDFEIKLNLLSRRKYHSRNVRYIAISRGVAEVLERGGVAPERITVVHSGVDPKRYINSPGRGVLRREWNVEEPGPVVGTVGSYVDHKDPLNLIEAAAQVAGALPRAKFVFVGDGELRDAMVERIAARRMEGRIILTGWQSDVGKYLAAMDLFVMPSKLEGLCTSLLDAQAVGLPCVASGVGGIPDVIDHEKNGLLVPGQDSDALARAIVRVWKSEELRARFAAAGPRIVAEKFSTEKMVEGTCAVYEAILR